MDIEPIRNDEDLHLAFKRLEVILQARAGTPGDDGLEIPTTRIEVYEYKHNPMGPASPVEAIKFRME